VLSFDGERERSTRPAIPVLTTGTARAVLRAVFRHFKFRDYSLGNQILSTPLLYFLYFNPNQSLQTHYTQDEFREVILQRNKFGHYVTSGEINGKPVTFLLDTGATGVAIPESTAKRLGLQRGRAYQSQTANGIAIGYATLLDLVAVGDIELQDVRAGIAPGLQGGQILLGMTFLKHIEFTQRGDTLILRQYL
jgi:aspartyl protease family protein